jgi:hypothetical protein
MTRRLPQCVLAVSLFCLFSAPPATSDPITITITDGSLLAVRRELAPPSVLAGAGLTFTTTVLHQPEVINLSAHALSTRHSEDGLVNAVLTLNGLRIDDFGGGVVADHTVDMFFQSQPRVAPPFGDFSPVTLTAPFTFDGFVNLYQQSRPGGGGLLFLLNGRGTATLRLRPTPLRDDGFRAWEAEHVRYDFESPAPIPEPSTMLLVATGLAAVVRYRRKRP